MMYYYTQTVVGNQWPPYAPHYDNKFISQWHRYSKPVTSFKASTHKVESTNLLSPTVNFVVTNELK